MLHQNSSQVPILVFRHQTFCHRSRISCFHGSRRKWIPESENPRDRFLLEQAQNMRFARAIAIVSGRIERWWKYFQFQLARIQSSDQRELIGIPIFRPLKVPLLEEMLNGRRMVAPEYDASIEEGMFRSTAGNSFFELLVRSAAS